MTYQEILDLIKSLNRSRVAEFKIKDGDFELSIRTDRYGDTKAPRVVSAPMPIAQPQMGAPAASAAAPAPAAPAPAAEAKPKAEPAAKNDDGKYLEIKSPMVGTFYRSATPEKPPFVEIGQQVNKGDVVCIIEAMKLFNEIEAEVSGKIVKVMVDNAKPVEYDQVLFLVEPD